MTPVLSHGLKHNDMLLTTQVDANKQQKTLTRLRASRTSDGAKLSSSSMIQWPCCIAFTNTPTQYQPTADYCTVLASLLLTIQHANYTTWKI